MRTFRWLYSELRLISSRNNLTPLAFVFLGTIAIVLDKITAVYNRIKYGKKQDEIKKDSVKYYRELEEDEISEDLKAFRAKNKGSY